MEKVSASFGIITPIGPMEVVIGFQAGIANEEMVKSVAKYVRRYMADMEYPKPPKFSVGDEVLIEVFDESNMSNGLRSMGWHPAVIKSASYVSSSFGYFYKPDFLYKNEADAPEFRMGYDYPEDRIIERR